MAFLFLFAALEFTYALNAAGIRRIVVVGGITFGLILSILYTLHSVRDRWQNVQVDSLTGDLNALGGATLSGNIQCLDTIDGCLATLYRLRLIQTTGMLYDEFLFLPPNVATEREANTVADLQERFLRELMHTPPYVIVMTSWLFPSGPIEYEKLKLCQRSVPFFLIAMKCALNDTFLASCPIIQVTGYMSVCQVVSDNNRRSANDCPTYLHAIGI